MRLLSGRQRMQSPVGIRRCRTRSPSWSTAWEDVARDFRGRRIRPTVRTQRLLRIPLDPGVSRLSPSHRRFVAARSMRDVEPNVALKLRDPYGGSVKD